MSFFLVVVLVLAGVALAIAPLGLPWSRRVHWLSSLGVLDYWGTPGLATHLGTVVVARFDHEGPRVTVDVREPGGRGVRLRHECPGPVDVTTAQLDRWRAAHTPLLLVAESAGTVSLHGPTTAVTGLVIAAASPEGGTNPCASPTRSPSSDPCGDGKQRPTPATRSPRRRRSGLRSTASRPSTSRGSRSVAR
jgi:hypothetical protein